MFDHLCKIDRSISSPFAGENMVKITVLLLVLVALVGVVQCRFIGGNSSELVSDGVNHGNHQNPFLMFLPKKGNDISGPCEQMYGFLPCSNTISGHLFLVLVYEYLLSLGENCLSWGNDQIFAYLGIGVFGASLSNIIRALPVTIFVLVSGLHESKDIAQLQVTMGVSMLAGSTILFLTIMWGTCVFKGQREFPGSSISNDSEPSASIDSKPDMKHYLSYLTGHGVTTDQGTSYTAMIMVSSLIPFIILLLHEVFGLCFWRTVVIFIALVVSLSLLLAYILYQIFEPWIQKRRLEFVKHNNLILGILSHVERQAIGNLLTEDGQPNTQVINRLFQDLDQDGSSCLSRSELKDLVLQIEFGNIELDSDDAVSKLMKELDLDGDDSVTREEFMYGFTKWLHEAKHPISKGISYIKNSFHNLHEVAELWTEKRREKLESMMVGMLRHVEGHDPESLLRDDGAPNIPCIRRLFEKYDLDGDKAISRAELKLMLAETKFKNIDLEKDNVLEKVMKELDADGNGMISEEEFTNAVTKWIEKAKQATDRDTCHATNLDDYLKIWEEADICVDEEKPRGWFSIALFWLKAISVLLFGIAALSFLSGALIITVAKLSEAAKIPTLFISFIIIPLATNCQDAVAFITSASSKKPRAIQLTFSEIYGAVFMNNVLCLFALLSLVNARGLTWNFSAEVLVIVLVGGTIGLMASFRSTFPLWVCCIAYLLYPLSLLLVYVLIYVFGWS